MCVVDKTLKQRRHIQYNENDDTEEVSEANVKGEQRTDNIDDVFKLVVLLMLM